MRRALAVTSLVCYFVVVGPLVDALWTADAPMSDKLGATAGVAALAISVLSLCVFLLKEDLR